MKEVFTQSFLAEMAWLKECGCEQCLMRQLEMKRLIDSALIKAESNAV